MATLFSVFIYPVIYIFPAYAANAAPVLFGGGMPLDLNRKFLGKPIFGRHKTIRGLAAGLLAGLLFAFAESLFIPYMLQAGILLGLGAMSGDLAGSFAKRRMGAKEGSKVFLLDQYPFLIFALLFSYPIKHLPGIPGILFLFILTGILHAFTNFSAHRLRLKKVPW